MGTNSGQLGSKFIAPGQASYDDLRLSWNRAVDQHPAAILVAETPEDMALGVRYARERGWSVAVQATGHGIQQPANNALLILTAKLNAVQVDPQARTATIQAGAVWQQVLDQTTPHGLAPLLGSSPTVGVVGYTLGGGIGWLGRRYGFAANHVRWMDVVTADGELRHTSPSENSDLFWGIRGGGGALGIVTAIGFDLFPVAKLYGGSLTYPGTVAREALTRFRDWSPNLPVEMTSSLAIMKFPDLPFLPDAVRGKILVQLRGAYLGDAVAGAALLQPWLDWQAPLVNSFAEMPFADIASISNDPVDPVSSITSGEVLPQLSDAAIELLARYGTDRAYPLFATEVRAGGGALLQNAPIPAAVAFPDAQYIVAFVLMAPTPEAVAGAERFVTQFKTELAPSANHSVYLNFLSGAEARERVRDGFSPETYQRLRTLKQQYDPQNLFRFGFPLGA